MCLDCGCLEPANSHGDDAHITLDDLQAAAEASGITPEQAAANILTTVTLMAKGDLPGGATDQAAAKSEFAGLNVIKASPERRYVLGVAYPALVAPGRGADNFNDFISEEALEKAAWEWMQNERQIGLFHKDGEMYDGHATVVESYISRSPAWTIKSPVDGSSVTVRPGDWMLGAVFDEYGWGLVKSGLVRGWSPEGGARRAVPSAERLRQLRS